MSRWRIEVDGRNFDIEVEDLADANRYRVVVDGQAHEVALAAGEDDSAAPSAAPPPLQVARAPAAAASSSLLVLGAPMPGVILRILVAPGAQVKRGQDIAVLEAMKMENMIRAPRDGVIAEVCVRQGQQLAHGEPVVRFEPGS